MLDGVTPVPAEFAARYRELFEHAERLARVLLDLGLRPLDRVIVQLPNTAGFAYLYLALQRIGACPVLALPGHRGREIGQFASISGAVAWPSRPPRAASTSPPWPPTS